MKNSNEKINLLNRILRIPDAELDIMFVLWQNECELRVVDIYNSLREVRHCSKAAINN